MLLAEVVFAVAVIQLLLRLISESDYFKVQRAMNHALQRLFEENGYQYKRGQKTAGRP